MATLTTYLLVSNPEDPTAVQSDSILEQHPFELEDTEEKEGSIPVLKFVATAELEEAPSLEEPSRELSAEYPEATITFCEVEERFGQVERLRTVVFISGKCAGDIDHGYVLNVGT